MRQILVVCALVATFESPIGQSIDGYVIRHTVEWCPDYYNGPRIRIDERVVNGTTGAIIGRSRERLFELPTKDKPATETAQDPETRPLGVML